MSLGFILIRKGTKRLRAEDYPVLLHVRDAPDHPGSLHRQAGQQPDLSHRTHSRHEAEDLKNLKMLSYHCTVLLLVSLLSSDVTSNKLHYYSFVEINKWIIVTCNNNFRLCSVLYTLYLDRSTQVLLWLCTITLALNSIETKTLITGKLKKNFFSFYLWRICVW